MSIYENPQEIWDSWVRHRDFLLKKSNECKNMGLWEKGESIDRELHHLWKNTLEELKLAALFKFLEITVTHKR